MMRRLIIAWFIAILAMAGGVTAAHADGITVIHFDNAEQETRYRALISELRCLVCQNQSLFDSNADLAKDMRTVVLQMLKDGETDNEIIEFMVQRYGNFVRYHPPFNWQTAVLWTLPFIIVVGLLLAAPRLLKNQRQAQLNDEDRQRAEKILKDE